MIMMMTIDDGDDDDDDDDDGDDDGDIRAVGLGEDKSCYFRETITRSTAGQSFKEL